MMLCELSEATGNLPWQAWTENLPRVSMSSLETPMTVAPNDSNLVIAWANSCASSEQPTEKAAGKKYSTTGPLARESASENLYTLPASAAGAVKFGAASPTSSAAYDDVVNESSKPMNATSFFKAASVLARRSSYEKQAPGDARE